MSLLNRTNNRPPIPPPPPPMERPKLNRIDRPNGNPLGPLPPPNVSAARPSAPPPTADVTNSEPYLMVKDQVQRRLLMEMTPGMNLATPDEARRVIEPIFTQVLSEENVVLNRQERLNLFESILAEIIGYGPIQPLLDDDSITEIMVNGPKKVYIERKGKLTLSNVAFTDNEHVLRIIERIVTPLGRRIDESSPMVDARLPDGSRVNAVIPPLSLDGPCLTIRKFSKIPFTADDMLRFGTFTTEFIEFTQAAVEARLNIIVSGGTGSGKTTALNILSAYIPSDERIVTIEDSAELQLKQEHVVRLESRPANIEGKGRISIRDLVINALRMRPERIVVGEVRGGEALDMLQAMNTGHDGSMTTAHSNGPRDTISRIETMVLMAGMDLPLRAIRQQVASAIDLVIHLDRLRDGSRKVTRVSEVIGMEGDTVLMQDVFVFQQRGMDGDKILGRLEPTGLRPKVYEKIEAAGLHLSPSVFGLVNANAANPLRRH
ncbi:CpaF family protein [Candidatus Amarolinea dominans]|uniref:CpaF family protein n=1 Tax=Candidatus Amarolinea dominans TaxID=3140696 RepID=UPI0031372E51|nr:CpaF family protein [Anaerolineae bacterium]